MAEISLKIKSDFEKAAADFKQLDMSSESFKKSLAKLQAQMDNGSIDKFMNKNKLNAAAITATKGATAGLSAELAGLQREMTNMIKRGLDPMSPALDKMKVRMTEIQKQLPRASSSFGGLGSAIGSVGMALGTAGIAYKMYDIAKSSLQAAMAMEQQQVAFTTMLGSAEKANALLLQMQTFAESTPFEFTEIVDAGKRMIAFGFSAQEVIPKLRAIGDVSAGLGVPLGDMAYLFGTIKTAGRAMTQDLNQFANRGIPIYDELAKVLGISTSEVKKFAEQGKIGFKEIDQVFQNLTTNGGKFAGLMDAQSKTLAGQWSNFNDQLTKSAIILGNEMMPAAKTWLGFASNILKATNETSATFPKINTVLWDLMSPVKVLWDYNTKIVDLANQYLFKTKETTGAFGPLNASIENHKNKVMQLAAEYQKANGGKPEVKTGGGGTKQSEAQVMQNQLVKMAGFENQVMAERTKAAEDFYTKKAEMELSWGSDSLAWQFEQASLIANNDKLNQQQKLAAMKALETATAKHSQKMVQNQLQFGAQVLGSTSSMLQNIQIVMQNAGKKSKELAYLMKGVAIAEATVNTSLAFTKSLAAFPWPFNLVAAGITAAAGAAQVAAIASTPIKAETGLQDYTVPDIRSNRNDGAPVMAQAGERVTVTPRGEDSNQVTSVNISIGETQLFSIIQRGINTGQINVSNKNVGSAVFAR